ncbi:3-ketoacyl-ACP reductase [Paracoccaceae bacterium GXU_MW_L88]
MKRALITGGNSGIGFGIAKALAGAGYDLALAGLDTPDSESAQAACAALPGARYYRFDQADLAAIPSLLTQIAAAQGPLTTFVANAGVGAKERGDMLDLPPENFDFALNINLRGAFFLAQAVAKEMLAEPSDHYRSLHFITSVSAEMLSIDRAEYCLSKAAAANMAKLFALRLAPHGIGVFDLRPGIIRTPMTEKVAAKYDAALAGGLVPEGRWGLPEDIGAALLPLAEGQMAFSTGATIPVDGALSLPRL